MKYHRLIALLGAVVFAAWGQSALAAAVMLNPESPVVEAGSTFNVEFFLDANDALGPHPGNFCGEVRIDYDPTLLTFVASSGALVELDRATRPDGNESISFAFDDVIFDTDPDAGVVGNFTFEAIGGPGIATIGIADNQALTSFFNHADPVTRNPGVTGTPSEFFPSFSPANVQVVPLPAAAWLFLAALGGLGLVGRKSRAAKQLA